MNTIQKTILEKLIEKKVLEQETLNLLKNIKNISLSEIIEFDGLLKLEKISDSKKDESKTPTRKSGGKKKK